MGCFDTVTFSCPNCDKIIEEQSKAGRCNLITYSNRAVPLSIADDLQGDTISCECGKSYKIILDRVPNKVPLALIEDYEDDDW